METITIIIYNTYLFGGLAPGQRLRLEDLANNSRLLLCLRDKNSGTMLVLIYFHRTTLGISAQPQCSVTLVGILGFATTSAFESSSRIPFSRGFGYLVFMLVSEGVTIKENRSHKKSVQFVPFSTGKGMR